jgi:hypothetical protein
VGEDVLIYFQILSKVGGEKAKYHLYNIMNSINIRSNTSYSKNQMAEGIIQQFLLNLRGNVRSIILGC